MNDLQVINGTLIKKYVSLFDQNEKSFFADQAIVKLFKSFPANSKLEDILLKISVINDLYSTNIFGTFKMAKHILGLQIDNAINIGDPQIVNRIAIGHGLCTKKNDTELNFYSFATKYCAWHNPDCYAIYDSFVDKVLISYRNQDNFSDFKNNDLRDFTSFMRIISDLKTHYQINDVSLKDIDKFLWMYGKEKFPTKYLKKNDH